MENNPKKSNSARRKMQMNRPGLHPGTDGPNREQRRQDASPKLRNKNIAFIKKLQIDKQRSEARKDKYKRFIAKVAKRRKLKESNK